MFTTNNGEENKFLESVQTRKENFLGLEAHFISSRFSELINLLLSAVMMMKIQHLLRITCFSRLSRKIYVKFHFTSLVHWCVYHRAWIWKEMRLFLVEERSTNFLKKRRRILFLNTFSSLKASCIHFRDFKVHLTFKYHVKRASKLSRMSVCYTIKVAFPLSALSLSTRW